MAGFLGIHAAGFLGTHAAIQNDIVLIVQILILLLLFIGLKFKIDKKLRKHGLLMSSAVILHLITIFSVMIPSIAFNIPLLLNPSIGTAITFAHAITGAIAMILGIYLVVSWKLSQNVSGCAKRKKIMRPLIVIWALSLLLGITFYVYFYV